MSDGYYLMHRGWQDHPVFGADPYSRRDAFEWLVAQAGYGTRDIGLPGRIVRLERGQLCHSLRHMASVWRWTEAKVRRFLARLQAEGMIRTHAEAGQTIVALVNYDRYQPRTDDSSVLRRCQKTDAGTDAATDVASDSGSEGYDAASVHTDAAIDATSTQHRRSIDANKKEGKESNKETTRGADAPPAKASRKKAEVAMPEAWAPNDRHAELARAEGTDLDEQADLFRDHHAARGSRFVDWDRAFSGWLRKAKNFSRGGQSWTPAVLQGGLSDFEERRQREDEAKRQREQADEIARRADEAWTKAVASRFAREPDEKRAEWKDRIRPQLRHMESRPELHERVLRRMVYEAYGAAIGMPAERRAS
jgi:hypothetical protein